MMTVNDKVVESGGKYESSGASRSEEGVEIKQCCNVIFCNGVDGDDDDHYYQAHGGLTEGEHDLGLPGHHKLRGSLRSRHYHHL